MWTLRFAGARARRLLGRSDVPVKSLASRSWQIAPPETTVLTAAKFLPGQLERVTGYEFAPDDFRTSMYGGTECQHSATIAYLLEDAFLVDSVLYKGFSRTVLGPPARRIPPIRVDAELDFGVVYCTYGGNRYFGQWLIDDCVTYPMAAAEGAPVTCARRMSDHEAAYEQWLEMEPSRVRGAHFRRLMLFDDFGQNRHKCERFRGRVAKLRARAGGAAHPGVFVLRGGTGARRIMHNEREVAEKLSQSRGLRIVDPMSMDVPTILRACAGAELVVGVEGSHLVHAMMVLEPSASLLTLQPPFRFCTVLKDVADREGIQFGFVVGTPHAEESHFTVDLDDIERTIELMLSKRA